MLFRSSRRKELVRGGDLRERREREKGRYVMAAETEMDTKRDKGGTPVQVISLSSVYYDWKRTSAGFPWSGQEEDARQRRLAKWESLLVYHVSRMSSATGMFLFRMGI